MDSKELTQKNDPELTALLMEERERLRGLRFRVSEGQLSKVSDIDNSKKTIARVLTERVRRENMQEKENSVVPI